MIKPDILNAAKHPTALYNRLEEMVFSGREVCVRLEMETSPISIRGTMTMTDTGHYFVESPDNVSYARFTLQQVTSVGKICIWITP